MLKNFGVRRSCNRDPHTNGYALVQLAATTALGWHPDGTEPGVMAGQGVRLDRGLVGLTLLAGASMSMGFIQLLAVRWKTPPT